MSTAEAFADFHGCVFLEIENNQMARLEQPVRFVTDSHGDLLGVTGCLGVDIIYLPWHRIKSVKASKEENRSMLSIA